MISRIYFIKNLNAMNIKKLLIISICTISINTYAQSSIEEKVATLEKQLTTKDKIDLLCAKAPEIAHANIIRYDWWSECLHGVARAGKATVFPKPIGLGSTWDVDLIKRISTAISDYVIKGIVIAMKGLLSSLQRSILPVIQDGDEHPNVSVKILI